ncbi:MAG: ArsR family transcriptional regulator [Balneola sp.]|nr:MAG: ArsR family transcriptional regulator [Balneola sp.]
MRIRAEVSSPYIVEKDHKIAELANALSHPLRVALVRYLDEKDKGEGLDNVTCNKDLVQMFDYSQSTMSQHVKVLRECGLFLTENKDKFTLYYLNRDMMEQFSDFISSFTADK